MGLRPPLTTSWFLSIDGTLLLPGRYVLVLAPKTGGIPMTLELRRGDGREIFADLAAMATPSAAETVYKSAAKFEPARTRCRCSTSRSPDGATGSS